MVLAFFNIGSFSKSLCLVSTYTTPFLACKQPWFDVSHNCKQSFSISEASLLPLRANSNDYMAKVNLLQTQLKDEISRLTFFSKR